MTGSGFLLDTNVFIEVLNGNLVVEEDRVTFLSSIVLGELYYGARNSSQVKGNLAKLEKLYDDYRSRRAFLACTEKTAYQYGLIKGQLRQSGRPIPENDIWLAAASREHGLILVSRDRHFQHVKGLARESW